MSSLTRIYLVTTSKKEQRLVRAATQAQALRHVARQEFKIEVPAQEDFAKVLIAGIKIEDAKESDDE